MNGWRRIGVLACGLWVTACTVLVDPDSLVIKCEVTPGRESEDPCLPAGMHCVASECKPCRGATEICNGVDDDCDGVVDNGHDEDGDGFTWCGGGIAELADCAPNDATIHPAGKPGPDGVAVPAPQELCDGKDNDCDSKVDEAPECEAMHSCVQDGCPTGLRCDTKTGTCFEPRPVGSGCRYDSECAGGFCVRPGDYGLEVDLTDNRCAKACCDNDDCDAGSVCVVGASGSRMCLPANIVVRGNKALGDRCSRDQECASGTCDRQRCAQRCVDDAACTSGACVLSQGSISEPRAWLCAQPEGRSSAGDFCSALLDPSGGCRSGYCDEHGECTDPCGRDANCGEGQMCAYTSVRPLLSAQYSVISACEPSAAVGSNDRLCCTSADCGEDGLCAPKAIDSRSWAMVCH